MTPGSRLLAASIGKSFVAAAVLALQVEGALGLDDPLLSWLGDRPWFDRLPPRFFALPDQDGTIAPGRRADLVLLAGNPLDDLAVLRRPLAVVSVASFWSARLWTKWRRCFFLPQKSNHSVRGIGLCLLTQSVALSPLGWLFGTRPAQGAQHSVVRDVSRE